MLVFVTLPLVCKVSTGAKYVSAAESNGSVRVAKWAPKVTVPAHSSSNVNNLRPGMTYFIYRANGTSGTNLTVNNVKFSVDNSGAEVAARYSYGIYQNRVNSVAHSTIISGYTGYTTLDKAPGAGAELLTKSYTFLANYNWSPRTHFYAKVQLQWNAAQID